MLKVSSDYIVRIVFTYISLYKCNAEFNVRYVFYFSSLFRVQTYVAMMLRNTTKNKTTHWNTCIVNLASRTPFRNARVENPRGLFGLNLHHLGLHYNQPLTGINS
jgi:hypothetical protein